MLTKVLGGAVGVCVIIILFLFARNGGLREELGASNQALRQVTKTNEVNVANFDDVNARLLSCVDGIAVDKAANEVTVANLEARYAELETKKNKIQIRREIIFRDPQCAELRDLDIDAICPAWSDGLRRTASGDGDTRR